MKKKRKVLKYSSGNDSLIANRNLPEPNKCDLRNWQELRIINNKEGSYLPLAECGVESLVAVFGGTPNLVLNGAMNVVLTVRLDDKESRIAAAPAHVKVLWIVNVLRLQFLEDGWSCCCCCHCRVR
jgi:hypothetical protein